MRAIFRESSTKNHQSRVTLNQDRPSRVINQESSINHRESLYPRIIHRQLYAEDHYESHHTQDRPSRVIHQESSIESHLTQVHQSRVIYQSRVTLPRIINRLTSFKNHHESHPTQDHPSQVIHQSRVTLTRIINRLTSFKNHQPRIINRQCHIGNHYESHNSQDYPSQVIHQKSSIESHQPQDHQSRVILTNVSQFPTLLCVALVRLLPMFFIGGLNAASVHKECEDGSRKNRERDPGLDDVRRVIGSGNFLHIGLNSLQSFLSEVFATVCSAQGM